MGRFSTTVQIKSRIDRIEFVNSFCDTMKKSGLVICSKGEATLSYLLAFSDGGWVTFASEEYAGNSGKANEDAVQVASELNVTGFVEEIVDSDFAILKLFGGSGESDTVIVGNGSGYGIEDTPKGKSKCWEVLLAEGKSWEQLSEALEKNEFFVEDTLCGAAPMLGIDPKYMISDYRELSDNAESDKNIVLLYFTEEKDGRKGKSMSLNAAFIKVFGEALEPLGFKKIKSRHPYFVRVVTGGEIVHVITCTPSQGIMQGQKAFRIYGGAATVYRGKIDFTVSPQRNSNWFISNIDVYYELHPFEDNSEMNAKMYQFTYTAGDDSSIISELVNALSYTKQLLLPALDKVTNLSEYADFYWLKHPMILHVYYDKEWGRTQNGGDNEGLILLKIYDTNDYEAKLKAVLEHSKKQTLYLMKTGKTEYTQELLDAEYQASLNSLQNSVADYSRLLNDPQRNLELLNELERRKAINSEALRQVGLNL